MTGNPFDFFLNLLQLTIEFIYFIHQFAVRGRDNAANRQSK
jgi:hypothetical protein